MTFVDDTESTSSIDNYMLARDHVRRQNVRPPSRYEDANLVAYALAVADDIEKEEPKSFEEAKKSKDWKHWNNAADEEMDSLNRNHTWDLIERPKGQKTVGLTFVDFQGIDYNEIFSPVVKLNKTDAFNCGE